MDQQHDDLRRRLDDLGRARRRLASSVDASAAAMRQEQEPWPRGRVPARRYPRLGIVLLLSLVVFLGVIIQRRSIVTGAAPASEKPRKPIALEALAQPAPSAARNAAAPELGPFVVHIRATRTTRIRVLVDGTPLDWRTLQEGDEFLARPRAEMLVGCDDPAALETTVNQERVALGSQGLAGSFRLSPNGRFDQVSDERSVWGANRQTPGVLPSSTIPPR